LRLPSLVEHADRVARVGVDAQPPGSAAVRQVDAPFDGGQLGDVVGADAEVLALLAPLPAVDDDHADPHRAGVPGTGAVGPDLDGRAAHRRRALLVALRVALLADLGAGPAGRGRRFGGPTAWVGRQVER